MTAEPRPSVAFTRAFWDEITTVRPDTVGPWSAVRVGVAVTVPLATLLAAGRVEWIAYASFGALCSVYGKAYGWTDRARAQAGAGAALVLAVLLGVVGGVVGPASVWPVVVMSGLSVLGLLLTRRFGWMPVPSLFLVFTAGTISSVPHAWGDLPEAALVATAAAGFGVGVGQAGRVARALLGMPPHPAATRRPVPVRDVLGGAGAGHQAAQYAAGPFVAGLCASALGIGHPYWAAVTATVPLVGASLPAQLGRAALRLLGTVLGLGIAYVVLAPGPPVWVLVLAVAVLQVVTELYVARNYGIAVIAITPLALVLSAIAVPAGLTVLLVDRLASTVVGVVVAGGLLVVGHAWGRRAPAAS